MDLFAEETDEISRQKYIENLEFPNCDEVSSKYIKLVKIGQGTFGEVFKSVEKQNEKHVVALKKLLMDEIDVDGFPLTALRELRILQHLKHENIVNLIEICQTRLKRGNNYKYTFHLVFDFCEHDLAGILANTKIGFLTSEIKRILQQLLNGLYYIHSNNIIHRDIKAANILLTRNGVLKLADFGLARSLRATNNNVPNRYTNKVVTLWYRPPELLLGERNYGPAIDLWGVGCIMAEMWTRVPIMQGSSEQDQLLLVSKMCGSITPQVWPGVEKLELFHKIVLPKGHKRVVKNLLDTYARDRHACDLLDKLLVLDPSKRIDANAALDHDFFWSDPTPCDLANRMRQIKHSNFEFSARNERSGHTRQFDFVEPGWTASAIGGSF